MNLEETFTNGETTARTLGENPMSPDSSKVMVVLPTYNERENIPELVAALFDLNIANFHLLIVDDNSPDGTGKIADEIALSDTYLRQGQCIASSAKAGLGTGLRGGVQASVGARRRADHPDGC